MLVGHGLTLQGFSTISTHSPRLELGSAQSSLGIIMCTIPRPDRLVRLLLVIDALVFPITFVKRCCTTTTAKSMVHVAQCQTPRSLAHIINVLRPISVADGNPSCRKAMPQTWTDQTERGALPRVLFHHHVLLTIYTIMKLIHMTGDSFLPRVPWDRPSPA